MIFDCCSSSRNDSHLLESENTSEWWYRITTVQGRSLVKQWRWVISKDWILRKTCFLRSSNASATPICVYRHEREGWIRAMLHKMLIVPQQSWFLSSKQQRNLLGYNVATHVTTCLHREENFFSLISLYMALKIW